MPSIGRNWPSATTTWGRLVGAGKEEEAEEQYRKALAIREKLAADFPAVPDYRQDLAASHNSLGILLADCGKRARRRSSTARRLASGRSWPPTSPPCPTIGRNWPASNHSYGDSAGRSGETSRGGGAVPPSVWHPGETGRRLPRRARLSAGPGRQPQQPGDSAGRLGKTNGGGGAVPPGAGHPGEAGRRLPRRARLSN